MNKNWHLEDFGFQNKDFVTLIMWIILYRWSNVLSKELKMLFESFSNHAGMIKQKNDITYFNWSYMDLYGHKNADKKYPQWSLTSLDSNIGTVFHCTEILYD